MNSGRNGILLVVGLLGGFILSFVGLGVLWAGAPWPYQMLMFFPFLLLALGVKRFGGNGVHVLIGAIPVAAMLVQFRDKDNSHLMPILVVIAWLLGILLGHYVGGRISRLPDGHA
jgi:hypothetical protein